MNRLTFLLRMEGDTQRNLKEIKALRGAFENACAAAGISNFSLWHMQMYLFGYGEMERKDDTCLDGVFAQLPRDVRLICPPGSMKQMYHDLGIVRQDKALIRHRVFATRLKPGCADEYKRRHDGLIQQRGDVVKEGPESNFTIWLGDGCIFGYCEMVRAFDGIEPTPEQKAWTRAWETRQLEIMDWLTDDVDWLTGEVHPAGERIF